MNVKLEELARHVGLALAKRWMQILAAKIDDRCGDSKAGPLIESAMRLPAEQLPVDGGDAPAGVDPFSKAEIGGTNGE